jgi:hypothetical protein
VRRIAILLLTVLAASSANVAQASTSRSELIRRGDALCVSVKRELAPLRARAEAAKTLPLDQKWTATADLWTDQVRIQKRFVKRFHAIGLPANDAAARALSRGLDRGVVLAQRVQRAFAERDTLVLPDVLPTYVSFTLNLNERTRAYGFRVCGH